MPPLSHYELPSLLELVCAGETRVDWYTILPALPLDTECRKGKYILLSQHANLFCDEKLYNVSLAYLEMVYFVIFVAEEMVSHKMASSNENIFRITGLLCREFTGHQWIPRTDAELWSFLWSTPGPTVEQIMETPVIWDAIVHIMSL